MARASKKKAAKKAGKKTTKKGSAKSKPAQGKPPAPTRKHGRQGSLPGTTEPDIKELDELCAEFKDHDDSMHAHKAEANKLRGAIAVALEKHDRKIYEYADKRFVYEPGAPKLKVQTIKTDED